MAGDIPMQRALAIRAVVSDVDGVLTDGGMYYGGAGIEFKKFSVRDGVGVALLNAVGIKFGGVTGEACLLTRRRFEKIKADFLISGVRDKQKSLREMADASGIDMAHIAYVGDDINDLPLVGQVGLFFCVRDANPLVVSRADCVLSANGGTGAIRDLALQLLNMRQQLGEAVSAYQARQELLAVQSNVDPGASFMSLSRRKGE